MNEKEIKVNNSEELIAKIKELVAEDSSWKLAEEYWVSSTVSYEPDGREKTIKKPRQGGSKISESTTRIEYLLGERKSFWYPQPY